MVVGQQDQIVLIVQLQRRGDFLIKGLPQLCILQLAGAQLGQELVLRAVHDLLRGKRNVDQVLVQRAGQRLAQQLQIVLRLSDSSSSATISRALLTKQP